MLERGRGRDVPEARVQPHTLDTNLEAITRWEREAMDARSLTERLADAITRTAARGEVVLLHAAWFLFWLAANLGWLPGVTPFDPYPFPLLTTTVSLEAIFLTLFVLGSQERLARQADKRAHLDLQIDLLAEREMTAVLRLLYDIADHLQVKVSVSRDELRDLASRTDIQGLTAKVETVNDESGPARPQS